MAATVAATAVGLGLATGTGALAGPLATTFGVGTGTASVVFAATLATMLALGAVTGPLAERHGARPLVALAAILVPGGLLVLAAAPGLPVAAAGFVLGVGGGAGCLFVPLQAAVGVAFERHRGPALVVATAGAGLATVIAPPATVALVALFGLRGAAVVLAAVAAAVLGACLPAAPAGGTGSGSPAAPEPGLRAVLADRGFRRLGLGAVGLSAAMFVPFVHLAPFAALRGIDLATGAALVAAAGAASLAARLAVVPAVARWGAFAVFRAGAVTMTLSLGLWAPAHSVAALAGFALVFGGAHGTFVGLTGATAAELFGVVGFGRRLGVLHLAAAAGGLVGPGTAGLVAEASASPAAGVAVAAVFGVGGCTALWGCRTGSAAQRPGHLLLHGQEHLAR
ncbi:MFS transporter [Actinomycetospora chibensis]|uniref:MFS transporter n=1 Tax=Actinomycetospora chibensis TaxID=663606 RepID=A0ABV9RFC7_9PSEU|nr:MFS transporter [Actinomycetospora chibensis]MDD7924074.1 MFS transporter [Actinomycetospora chibensis]